jgi:hypothetical protein
LDVETVSAISIAGEEYMANIAQAQWIHGHAIQAEQPEHSTVRRLGFYARVNGSGSQWFHFAVPTPVIVADYRLKIGSIVIRYRTGSADVRIKAVHIYDGETRIASHDGLSLTSTNWDAHRFDVPNHPHLQWGLGVLTCGKSYVQAK